MAIQITEGTKAHVVGTSESDDQLQHIVHEVHHYLDDFCHHKFYFAIRKSRYQKCVRSWSRVSTHLDKFLFDPKSNYSLMVVVLEHEMQKFPKRSFYSIQLHEIEKLISHGPSFTCPAFDFIIPDG